MRIAGERIKRTRLIQTDRYVVAVAVEMVIPADDPGEPCYEAETVQLLREVKRRAEEGEVAWLRQHGRVYIKEMNESRLPPGWDAKRVQRLINHEDSLTEDAQTAKDEAAADARQKQAANGATWLAGDRLFQKRARAALPLLVRQAQVGSRIRYGDLAAELGMKNPRNLNHVLGRIGHAIKRLAQQWQEEVPPITCIVISKKEGLPGEGVGWFVTSKEEFRKLPKAQQRRLVEVESQKVFAYPRWLKVLQAFGLQPVRVDYQEIAARAAAFRARAESEDHRRLKEYAARSPHLFGLPTGASGETEYSLPSGDEVDVLFRNREEWVAVEVKSQLSPEADIVRGIFQCVKYRAVIEAYQASLGRLQGARSVLVLQNELPGHLVPLKNMLGVKVLDRVQPR